MPPRSSSTPRRSARRRSTGGCSSRWNLRTVPVLILVIFVLNLVPAVAPRPPPLRKASVAELREGAISGREQRLRAAALDRFAAWLNVAAGETVEVLARASPLRLSEHLEEYLYQLFEMR